MIYSMVLGQLPPRKIAPPNPKANPNPKRGAIFLGGNCPNINSIRCLYLVERCFDVN